MSSKKKMLSFYPHGDSSPAGRNYRFDILVDEETGEINYPGQETLTAEKKKDLLQKWNSSSTMYEQINHRQIALSRDEMLKLFKQHRGVNN